MMCGAPEPASSRAYEKVTGLGAVRQDPERYRIGTALILSSVIKS